MPDELEKNLEEGPGSPITTRPYRNRQHCDEKANSSESGIGCDFDEFDSDRYHSDNKTYSHVKIHRERKY